MLAVAAEIAVVAHIVVEPEAVDTQALAAAFVDTAAVADSTEELLVALNFVQLAVLKVPKAYL